MTDGSASSSEKGSQKQVIQSHKESLFSPSPPFEGKGNALASFMLLEYHALKKTAYGRKCLFGLMIPEGLSPPWQGKCGSRSMRQVSLLHGISS